MLILIGLAAGACTFAGAATLMLKRNWKHRELAFFLGLASGVMISVVIFDLLPSALVAYEGRGGLTGVALGVIITWLISRFMQATEETSTARSLGYLIMLAIALHDLPEGMAIALGGELKERTAMVIALAIGIHNIPEGMAIAAPLLMGGIKRSKILLQVALLGFITPLGTLIGTITVRACPASLPLFLGFASGVMLTLVVRDLWPQARNRSRCLALIGGLIGVVIIMLATFI
ncbi:MAG: ZIP family metal transporter [Methanomassiliicoccales archaeon]